MDSVDSLKSHRVRAEPLIELAVRAFHQKIIVDRAKHGAERVGVDELPGSARLAAFRR